MTTPVIHLILLSLSVIYFTFQITFVNESNGDLVSTFVGLWLVLYSAMVLFFYVAVDAQSYFISTF